MSRAILGTARSESTKSCRLRVRSRNLFAMSVCRFLASVSFFGFLAAVACDASHLVTGNGFGFAVVSPEDAAVTKFYAHPYSFLRSDPKNPLSEGVETANFIKVLGWGVRDGQSTSADYDEDSHVIRVRGRGGNGFVFMPFGLRHAVLIVDWEPGNESARQGGLRVEWNHPVKTARAVKMLGAEMWLLTFD